MQSETVSTVRLLLRVFLVSVALFFVWEKLQMPYYIGMGYYDLASWLMCFQAAIGDGVIVVAILAGGRLLFRDWRWPVRYTPARILFLLAAGFAVILVIEVTAIIFDRWSYSEAMPVVTIAGYQVGLVAVAQMLLMPYLSLRIALSRPL